MPVFSKLAKIYEPELPSEPIHFKLEERIAGKTY